MAFSEERYWLIDAAFKKGRIKLQFALESSGQLYEFSDPSYRPYFYTMGAGGNGTMKTNLFTNGEMEVRKILGTDSSRFESKWEDDISPAMSYVYDRDIHFCVPHLKSSGGFRPQLEEPNAPIARFDEIFRETERKDPLKYQLLRSFFRTANQPIPSFLFKLPIYGAKTTVEKIHSAILLSRLANIPLPEAYKSRGVSFWITSILDSYYRSNNVLIPSPEELRKGDDRRSVQGALTIAPQSGTYFGMVVLDFESLYPGCMDVFNLSYETVNCGHTACQANKVPGLDIHICRERRGIYSAIIGALRELRVHWYKPISRDASLSPEDREQAKAAAKILKLILVSCYGVTVRIHGLASPLLAESITAYGRYILSSTWRLAEELGLRPRYGDTDSIFLDNPTQGEVDGLIRAVKERFDLDLTVEKRFSLCVLSGAMKAYFGILTSGIPDLKGLSVIKSNSPRLFQRLFDSCVAELVGVRDLPAFESAKKRIVEKYEQSVLDLRRRNFELPDLAYAVEIHDVPEEKFASKFLPQPYQAAKLLRDRGVLLREWDEVRFIKVTPFRYEGRNFTVKPADQVSPSEVNVEDYVRTLRLALGQVFEPMGISFEQGGVKTTLADFT